eukprot:12195856-Prorocentrum_lima.AAC.1
MRDASLFSAAKVWSAEDSDVADMLLQFVSRNSKLPSGVVPETFAASTEAPALVVDRVWNRLQEWPFNAEIEHARGVLLKDAGAGGTHPADSHAVYHILDGDWKVHIAEWHAYTSH